VAVQTVAAFGSAARLQVTAGLPILATTAVYCTVLGAVVLTGTDAGDTGDEVTVTVTGGALTLTSACPVVVLSSFEVAVTTIPQGFTGTVCGAVYVMVLVPVTVMVPNPLPLAVHTVAALE
jgi:predicted RecA/RadA family phage recombinase